MTTKYDYSRKKRIADKISKISNKEDQVSILEIINEENKDITENKNGLFLYFDGLTDGAYQRIERKLRRINKKRKYSENSETKSTEKMEYVPYANDEFPSQNGISPKLKYSNKEKNLINRRRYDKNINANNNGVIYTKFDINVLTDSDKSK